jgi:archaellum component FlaC
MDFNKVMSRMKTALTTVEENSNKINGMSQHIDSLASLVSEVIAKHSVMESKLEEMAEIELEEMREKVDKVLDLSITSNNNN